MGITSKALDEKNDSIARGLTLQTPNMTIGASFGRNFFKFRQFFSRRMRSSRVIEFGCGVQNRSTVK